MAEIKITNSKQLLVEGRTSLIFFTALLRHLNLFEIDVQNFGSNEELSGFLQAFTTRSEFKDRVSAYAIIRDAEQKPASSAFASICHSIRTAGHEAPEAMAMFTTSMPRVGVYVLPDCSETGMLETLCLKSVMTPQLSNCISSFFDCTGAVGAPCPPNQTKAYARAFLATQDIDESQVGRAAQKGIWNWNHTTFVKLQTFLRAL